MNVESTCSSISNSNIVVVVKYN